MPDDGFDVVVAGAGAAGSTAALELAHAGRRVALLDRHAFPRPAQCSGWLNAKALPVLQAMGVALERLGVSPFQSVTFHDGELARSASHSCPQALGYLVDRAEFDALLLDAARDAGVNVMTGMEIAGIQLGESGVAVRCGPADAVSGRFLVLATGRETPLLERLGFARHTAARGAWAVFAWEPSPGREFGEGVDVVLSAERGGAAGWVMRSSCGASVALFCAGEKAHVRSRFVELCRRLEEKQIVPASLTGQAACAPILFAPAAFALDMDTHVGKNTLVVGDAGGFSAALSHEGVFPSMWSARIAADVIANAFGTRHPQDALSTYETRWRNEMASYLSPPNTDMHYLLPMIFTNPAMAERIARAFFLGEML